MVVQRTKHSNNYVFLCDSEICLQNGQVIFELNWDIMPLAVLDNGFSLINDKLKFVVPVNLLGLLK